MEKKSFSGSLKKKKLMSEWTHSCWCNSCSCWIYSPCLKGNLILVVVVVQQTLHRYAALSGLNEDKQNAKVRSEIFLVEVITRIDSE
jgi:hypothetical protein